LFDKYFFQMTKMPKNLFKKNYLQWINDDINGMEIGVSGFVYPSYFRIMNIKIKNLAKPKVLIWKSINLDSIIFWLFFTYKNNWYVTNK